MSYDKPWDEDWYPDFGDDENDPVVMRSGDDSMQAAWIENERCAKLIASAPDLVRALLAVEWIYQGHETGERECPWCMSEEWQPHADGCLRQAALRKAGVL